MTPEGKVKDRVKALLKAHGAYYHMPVQNGMGKPSLDFVVCHEGRFAAIETKAGADQPTPRQMTTITEIQRAKGPCFVINDVSGMEELRLWLTRA